MISQRYGVLTLLVVFVSSSASLASAGKEDYSSPRDKTTQRTEEMWNPRAGLRLLADVVETEINDTCPGQAVACGDVLTQATLTPSDVDYIHFEAVQGDVLVLGTDSVGGLDPDTKITLLKDCGATLETDDDSGPGLFSLLTHLVSSTGTYVLRIEGIHAGVVGDYAAYVSCAPRDPADICATAPTLPCGAISITSTTIGATNDYDLTDGSQNLCTGFATAGADLVYVIDEPQFSLSVTYTSTVDGALYLITNCSNPRGSCVAGSDVTLEGQPETINYTTTEPGPYYLVLDNFVGNAGPAGDFTLTGFLDCPPSRWVNVAGFTNTGAGLGAAWGDYDKDGDVDVYLPKYGEANALMRNDGAGLSAVSDPLLEDTGNSRAAAWADYDNDGDLDLYVSNAQSANKLFANDGAGGFTAVTGSPINDTGDGRGVAWADYDNDGDVDLYLANAFSANKLFENDGAGGFTDVTTSPLDDAGNGTSVAWADYDNDGDLDLYLVNHGQANRLFENDGVGGFTDVTSAPLDDTGDGRGATWADYDNDGDLDLYLSNALSANKLFRNDGAGGFTDVTPSLLADAGDGRGVEWGDYDNDGDLDLYLANVLSANKLFDNDGAGGFVDVTTALLADMNSSQGVASADYDGDGDLDIYLVNTLNFDRLFRNDLPAGNHWLHVDLEGTTSNRSAIGARVRVVAGGVTQIREVAGGSGYLSQGSLTLEFGLGAATVADTVQVCWPGGAKMDSVNVAVDRRISLVEALDVSDTEETPRPTRLTLLHNVPDPFNPSTAIRYLLPGPSTVRITIHDARGRVVRHLLSAAQAPGLRSVAWNGTDDAGATLPSGTYVARIETDHGSGTEKLTLLK